MICMLTCLFCSNEQEVGQQIKKSGVSRRDIFVVTKVHSWFDFFKPGVDDVCVFRYGTVIMEDKLQ